MDIIVTFSGRNLQFKAGNKVTQGEKKSNQITVLSREFTARCWCVCQCACVKTPKNQASENRIVILYLQ